MDTRDLYEKGLELRRDMFGHAAVEKRMSAFGQFGEPLQNIINAYAYGDVWSRPGLPLATKSLAMVAMMAGAGRTNELGVHVRGALTNGCSAEQIRTSFFSSPCIAGFRRRTKLIASRSTCCVKPRVLAARPARRITLLLRDAGRLADLVPARELVRHVLAERGGSDPRGTTPALVNRSLTAAPADRVDRSLSLATISGGMPAARSSRTRCALVARKHADSIAGGTSGTAGKRSLPVTASALRSPDWTCPKPPRSCRTGGRPVCPAPPRSPPATCGRACAGYRCRRSAGTARRRNAACRRSRACKCDLSRIGFGGPTSSLTLLAGKSRRVTRIRPAEAICPIGSKAVSVS